ncbi:MAG: ATP synthase F1 subunit delta [Candidatus Lernaella stagnicola]|nr:ATP synthase F1 subunit delta [Candidatus Lernaella stagnicola]
MSANVLGRRYAGALLDLGVKNAKADLYGRQLAAAAEVLGDPAVKKALSSPLFDAKFKREIIDQAAHELQLSPTVKNFLRLLIDKRRITILQAITAKYAELLDEHNGIARATVCSAVELDTAALARLRVLLQRKVGRRIELTAHTDPSVVGGLRVQVGSKVYDATIASHLRRLREKLKH